MKKFIFPPLSISIDEMSQQPHQVIFQIDDGFYHATANLQATIPIWRRYKKIGWAKRYINKNRSTMGEGDLCQICGAILVENVSRCLRCGAKGSSDE